MKQNQKGFTYVIVLLILIVIAVSGAGYYVVTKQKQSANPKQTNEQKTSKTQVANSAPNHTASASTSCPDPVLQSPVDITKVTSVLYPGQTRNNQYKPHGGFRLDNSANDAVEVKAPMDAKLIDGSRYIEQNEQQYLLDFESACGVKYRFDHLLTLSPKFQAEIDKLPEPQKDDSRTTKFSSPISIKTGEVIATAVGFSKTHNVGFDFGVYDTRQPNAATKTATYAAAHPDLDNNEQLKYAVCWFDYLPAADTATLKALPAADQTSGKASDYCK